MANGRVWYQSWAFWKPSTACVLRVSHWLITALTTSHPSALSTRTTASSVSTVASTAGMPLRRIHMVNGPNADAKISARTSGMMTSETCRIPQISPATSTTTMMICTARMAKRPKPSAHRLFGGGWMASATASTARRGAGWRENRPMRSP